LNLLVIDWLIEDLSALLPQPETCGGETQKGEVLPFKCKSRWLQVGVNLMQAFACVNAKIRTFVAIQLPIPNE
jgi:hypothetical protein